MRTGDSGMIDHGHFLDSDSSRTGPFTDRCSRGLRWRLSVIPAACVLCMALTGQAAEPLQSFVEGLRDRGYYEIALTYLDQQEQRGSLPVELKELLSYERAQTLLASARNLNNLDAQRQQLDAAEAAFQQFAKASPNHPLAAQANTWRGRILFEKSRVEIFESQDPSHVSNRQEFQIKARTLLTEAKKVFEDAAAQHKKVFDQFPSFIPEGETVQHAARNRAENTYIEVIFDMGKCSYWEAKTFDRGSKEATEALQKASVEFTEMHDRYRNNTGGKFARLWQGKCYEELDQITQAMGVYEDLLSLTPDTPVKAALYDLALRFKLICLNHEQKKDYPLVVTLAEEWLASAKGRTRSEVGNGIQWELCRAWEQLGTDRSKPESEQAPALNQALARARTLSRTAGEFKVPANGMIQRLLLSLNRGTDDPTDFDSAFGMAGKLSDDIRQLSQQITSAQQGGKMDEVKAKQATLKSSASEMARLCDIALRMAKPTTDARLVDRASVLLAYGYLLDDRTLDAAAVGEYMLRSLAVRSPESAKNAGFIAMAAFDRAYQKADKGNRDFESRKLIEFASRLEQKFPESDQANDARLAAARVLWDQRKLSEAAEWWNKIPTGSTHYAGAQLSTGQAYWGHYTTQINLLEDKRPDKMQLIDWRDAAVRHLEIGIADRVRSIPADAVTPDDLTRGKLTLAQIRNLSGVYHTVDKSVGSIELLTEDPHSVIAAIAVPAGTVRPQSPGSPKSRTMASFAYQQLLKAQIGVKDLDAAREARFRLEEVAGSDDAEALTQVFVEFGQQLEDELKQLKAAGETDRATEVCEGFETFLNDLFNRQEGQSFASLFWIAETFTSLAEGSSEDRGRAQGFFEKAGDAYLKIIETSKADAAFSQSDQLLYSKMRLVNCKQAQGDFVAGEQVILELLKEKKAAESPNVQMAAASLYQAWAGSSEPDAWKKYSTAIAGMKTPVPMWGWAMTASRLQRALSNKSDARIASLEYEARYSLAQCQFSLAKQQPTPAEREKLLSQAKQGIATFARLSRSLPPEEYERFNVLYRSILQESGGLPVDLQVGMGVVVAPANSNAKPGVGTPPANVQPTAVLATEAPESTSPSKTNYGLILLLSLLGIGAVGGILFVSMRKPPDKYAARRAAASSASGTAPRAPRPAPVSPPASGPEAGPQFTPAPSAPKPKPTRLPGKPKSDPS